MTLGFLIGAILPHGVSMQRTTLSPNLQRVLNQATVVAVWDGTANDGSNAPRGVYIPMLVTPHGTFTTRIVYLGRNEE